MLKFMGFSGRVVGPSSVAAGAGGVEEEGVEIGPFVRGHFPFGVEGDAAVVAGAGGLGAESGVDTGDGVFDILAGGVVPGFGVVVGGDAEKEFAVGVVGEEFSGPGVHEVAVELGVVEAGVVHHDGDVVDALGDGFCVGVGPVNGGIVLPACGRRVGGDGEEFVLRDGGAEFFEEGEEGGVAVGGGFDVEVEACETRVAVEEGVAGFDEAGSPGGVVGEGGFAAYAADPWEDSEVGEGIEKVFHLAVVDAGEVAVDVAGAEVGEEVGDVVGAEFGGSFGEGSGVTEKGFSGLVVCGFEPVVVGEPAVLHPEGVVGEVVGAVAEVEVRATTRTRSRGQSRENGGNDEGQMTNDETEDGLD